MGTEGILVKTNDSAWESIRVGYAGPMSSYEAKDPINAMGVISTELILLTIFLLYLNVLTNVNKRNNLAFALLIAMSLITGTSFISVITSLAHSYPFNLLEQSAFYIFPVSAFITIVLLFQQLITNTNRPRAKGFIALVTIWLISCALFIFWAYGIIPVYETALGGVIILHVGYLAWLFFRFLNRKIQKWLPENS